MDPEQSDSTALTAALARIEALEDKVSDYEIRITALEAWADGE